MRDTQPRNILCVLAGGRSSRFGSSKLRVHLAGEPLLAWQVRRLVGAVGKVIPGRAEAWLNLAPDQRVPPGAGAYDRRIVDRVGFAGPLEGMAVAIGQTHRRDTITFIPADMPLIGADDLRRLAWTLNEHPGVVGVMSMWIDGRSAGVVEPFPSIWRAGASVDLINAAHRQHLAPKRLAGAPNVLCTELLADRDEPAWTSINQREDLTIVAEHLGIEVTPDAPE